MIEPVRDAFTTSTSPACSAKKAMISSAMLPNVALRIPPTCGPVRAPSRSVERPTSQASPRIAIADMTKVTVGSAPSAQSRMTVTTEIPTVASTSARAMGERAPRIGNRAAADVMPGSYPASSAP